MLDNITPTQLEATYRFLCTFPPFSDYKWPHADTVIFSVVGCRINRGWYKKQGNMHHIAVSANNTGQLGSLILVMAHEMLHLLQELEATSTRAKHNARFRELAKECCEIHGWDSYLF